MNIYVASSWKCETHHEVVTALRDAGHAVYDFTDPRDNGGTGFAWKQIADYSPGGQVDSNQFIDEMLPHPLSIAGFKSDFEAMERADACVLVLDCNRSAHWEAGWFSGRGKPVCVLLQESCTPELVYLLADVVVASLEDVTAWASSVY